jgi:hypothetical protein
MGIWITNRDKELIAMVWNYDRVSLVQVTRRFFPSYDTAQRRVRGLIKDGYLTCTLVPSQTGVGAARQLLGLGLKGRKLLELTSKEVSDMNHMEKLYPINHHLACCDFRVGMELACAYHQLDLINWKTDKTLQGEKEKPTPDASFTLVHPSKQVSLRLEMDMDTVPKKRMCQKIRDYYKKTDDRRLVLWDVPTEKRARYLLEWIKAVAVQERADHTMHLVAIRPQNPLDPEWRVVGIEHPVSLIGGFLWGSA